MDLQAGGVAEKWEAARKEHTREIRTDTQTALLQLSESSLRTLIQLEIPPLLSSPVTQELRNEQKAGVCFHLLLARCTLKLPICSLRINLLCRWTRKAACGSKCFANRPNGRRSYWTFSAHFLFTAVLFFGN